MKKVVEFTFRQVSTRLCSNSYRGAWKRKLLIYNWITSNTSLPFSDWASFFEGGTVACHRSTVNGFLSQMAFWVLSITEVEVKRLKIPKECTLLGVEGRREDTSTCVHILKNWFSTCFETVAPVSYLLVESRLPQLLPLRILWRVDL